MKNTHHKNQNKNIHDPVLLAAVLKYLEAQPGESYLDVTAGYGGHAKAIMDSTLKPSLVTLVDRDSNAITYLNEQFAGLGVEVVKKDYLSASKDLLKNGREFDIILADLGVSLPHLKEASRGFSFKSDGPLDMRMDQAQDLMASDIVNSYKEEQLAQIIKDYGEEHRARRIAGMIVKNRPIKGTEQLAELIKHASPGYSKVHPATKTFQAIRIAVNNELEQLQQALPVWVDLLKPGGRIGVISFHSLEDRIVKQFFRELSGDKYDSVLQLITKHPVVPDHAELVFNPRSRSAKLRVAAKINTKKG
jgi:16S rRNA (cytosine1402-N4)-methyltransferase